MATATRRRPFDPEKDAVRWAKLTDGETLFEVVDLRGFREGRPPAPGAELKLLDAGAELPTDPFEALDRAEWYPLVALKSLFRVEYD